MKKILGIAFIILLIFSVGGYYLLYMFKEHQLQEEVRHEMLKKLPLEKLEVIDAAKNSDEIVWEEKDREFYLDGKLYDVAAIKEIEGHTLIYCLNDEKEEELLKEGAASISSVLSQGAKQKSPGNFKFQLPDFISFSLTRLSLPVNTGEYGIQSAPHLCGIVLKINGPPPDITFKPNTVL